MSTRRTKDPALESHPIQKVLIQQSIHGVSILQDYVHKFVNKTMESITGYSADELVGMHYLKVLSPSSMPMGEQKYNQVIAGTFAPFTAEMTLLRKDGTTVDVRVYNDLIDFEGRPAVLSVVQDVSIVKKAEEALQESERRFLAFMNNFPGVAFMKDRQGSFIYKNTEFEAVYRDGSHGQPLQSRAFLRAVAHADRLDERVIATSRTIRTIERFPRDNRMHHWLLYRFPISNDKGKTTAMGGIGMDITERRQTELALKKSRERLSSLVANLHKVREDLSAQVSQEIHDELGQMLTAMKFDIAWLQKRIPAGSKVMQSKIATLSNELDQAIQSVGRIVSELRPRLLDELGITSAIKWYTEEFRRRTEIECDLLLEPEEVNLDQTTSTVIFRILQEALTNIARHSKATAVKIRLKTTAGKVTLSVIDNGIGITEEQINRPDAFGLMGVRERASSIGGTVRITGIPNGGTRVVVSVPRA